MHTNTHSHRCTQSIPILAVSVACDKNNFQFTTQIECQSPSLEVNQAQIIISLQPSWMFVLLFFFFVCAFRFVFSSLSLGTSYEQCHILIALSRSGQPTRWLRSEDIFSNAHTIKNWMLNACLKFFENEKSFYTYTNRFKIQDWNIWLSLFVPLNGLKYRFDYLEREDLFTTSRNCFLSHDPSAHSHLDIFFFSFF